MAKKTKKRHHPDYDPEVEAGSIYIQKEVAVEVMLAIAGALKNCPSLTPLQSKRLCVAATVINDVFGLGVSKARPAKRKAARP